MSRGKNINNVKRRVTPKRDPNQVHDHSMYLNYDYLNDAAKNMMLPDNPEQMMIVGDLHGDTQHLEYIARKAHKAGVTMLVQVGDFGYWPHNTPNYILTVDKLLKKYNLHMIVLDGNHENFAALNAKHPDYDQFKVLGRRVVYAPRGTAWEWQGKKILAVGGAASIDKAHRLNDEAKRRKSHQRKRWYWWHEENITDADVDAAKAHGQVDILLTHDCPSSVNLTKEVMENKEDPDTWANRQKLQRILEATKPKLLYHGHYHTRHSNIGGGFDFACQVEGLGRNTQKEDSFAILDLTEELVEP